MKRIGIGLFLCILLMGFFVLPASAESAASRVDTYCTVSAEGSCQVNMTVTLRMEYVTTSMSFPLPANATGITLNGASVSTSKTSSATMVDISRVVSGITGEIPLNFSFTLPKSVGVVTVDKERKLQLSVELLSGFEFPVEQLSFVITMPPGNMPNAPKFTSIYRQESIASDLTVTVSSNQIIGASKTIDLFWLNGRLDLYNMKSKMYANLMLQGKYFMLNDGKSCIQALASIGSAPEASMIDNAMPGTFSRLNTQVGLGGQYRIHRNVTLGVLGTWLTYYTQTNTRTGTEESPIDGVNTRYKNLFNIDVQVLISF